MKKFILLSIILGFSVTLQSQYSSFSSRFSRESMKSNKVRSCYTVVDSTTVMKYEFNSDGLPIMQSNNFFKDSLYSSWTHYYYDRVGNQIELRSCFLSDQKIQPPVEGIEEMAVTMTFSFDRKNPVFDTICQSWKEEFNNKGLKISSSRIDMYGKARERSLYEYDSKDSLSKLTYFYDSLNSTENTVHNIFSGNNRICTYMQTKGQIKPYSKRYFYYDQMNQLTETRDYSYDYPYEGDSLLLEQHFYKRDAAGKIVEDTHTEYEFRKRKNNIYSKFKFSFNSHGEYTEIIEYNKKGEAEYRTVFTYNDNGLLIEDNLFDKKGIFLQKFKYVYDFY